MIELMISMTILGIFASGTILAFTYSIRSAVTTRNQALARATVVQYIQMMQVRPWNTLAPDPVWSGTPDATRTVQLWQYTKGGTVTQINAEVDVWTEPNDDVPDSRVVFVRVTYVFQGKTITLESSTIRAQDS